MTTFEQNLSLYNMLQASSAQKFNFLNERKTSVTEKLPSISEHHMFSLPEINNNDLFDTNRNTSVNNNNDSISSSSSLVQSSSPTFNSGSGDDDNLFNDLFSNRLNKINKESDSCLPLPSEVADISTLLSKLGLNFDLAASSQNKNELYNDNAEEKDNFAQQSLQIQTQQQPQEQQSSYTTDALRQHSSKPTSGKYNNGENKNNSGAHGKLSRSASEPHKNGSNHHRSGNGNKEGTSYCRYKTELCRPFEENGSCKYGDKCQFAHGKHELRSLVRHPKYKTDLCKTYHTTGLCPYGPRCHFIHNDEERRLNLINKLFLEHKKNQALLELQTSQLLRQRLVAVQKMQMISECNNSAVSNRSDRNSSLFGRQMSLDTAMEQQIPLLLGLQSNASNSLKTSLASMYQQMQTRPTLVSSGCTTSSSLQLNSNSLNSSTQSVNLIDQLIYQQQLQKLQPSLQQQQQQQQPLTQQHVFLSYNNSLDSTSPSASSSFTDSPTPSPTMLDEIQQHQPQKDAENSLFLRTILENILKSSNTTASV